METQQDYLDVSLSQAKLDEHFRKSRSCHCGIYQLKTTSFDELPAILKSHSSIKSSCQTLLLEYGGRCGDIGRVREVSEIRPLQKLIVSDDYLYKFQSQ